MLVLDLARIFLGTAILAFGSFTDLAWRRAPNALWIALAAGGAVLLAAEVALETESVLARWHYLALVPVFIVFIYVMYQLGLIAGGADAKALMALAILAPFPLAVAEGLPFAPSPMPGPLTILGNALVAFAFVPLAFAGWNLARGDIRFPALLLGYRADVASLGRTHVWPMERVEEGKLRLVVFPSRDERDIDEEKAALEAAGAKRVWVTPKLPFLVPLLVGFVAAWVAGDALFAIIRAVAGR
ncbi:MAG TPA: A24 family peptidase C-terminal domain-containing protein [Candidatus Thermoplasmatota archaeon]|nr:A24 family peptidase C-terminal domain-containing protein [Candidatus Thermoplasmatota archaeon]